MLSRRKRLALFQFSFITVQVIVARQQMSKKGLRPWPSAVHLRANKMKKPRLALEEQDPDQQKSLDATHNMTKGNGLYLQALDKEFQALPSFFLAPKSGKPAFSEG